MPAIGEGLEICMEISGLRVWVNESRSAMSQSGWEKCEVDESSDKMKKRRMNECER